MMNGPNSRSEVRNYRAIADAYVLSVLDGTISACKWIKLAAQRYLDNQSLLNDEVGSRACSFIEKLPHVKGRWAARKEKLHLQPWQVWIVFSIFGTLNTDGLRRYRQAYICVPRKNGKSPLAAGIGLYMLGADGEEGCEVYCGATKEKQAWEVFRPAKRMVERTEGLRKALGVTVHASVIRQERTDSRFQPVIGSPGDGPSPHLGICDEFHEATDSTLYDAFHTGMVGREQPLLLTITTAGVNLSSPCCDLQGQAQKVLQGALDDPSWFVAIYTIDDGDDWTSEAALVKANPNYGVSVDPKTLAHDQKIAVANSAKANIFKTKHLDVWCGASVSWTNMVQWAACEDAALKEDDFLGCDCFGAIDLASKIDLAATLKLFRKEDHYYIFPRFYLPADRAQEPECQHYQWWVADGHLIATEGNVIDFTRIRDDMRADIGRFSIRQCAFDPWNAVQMAQELEPNPDPHNPLMVEVPQTVKNLSDPMKQLEAAIKAGRLHHNGNPVMTWCMSNVVAHTDANENVFPRKDKPENKIDGAVALINAFGRAILNVEICEPTISLL